MLTRSKSLSETSSMKAVPEGKSPVPNAFDNTVVSRPGLFSSPLVPCTSEGLSDPNSMSATPVLDSKVARPLDQRNVLDAKPEAAVTAAKDLELREMALNLKAKDLELGRMRLEMERMSFQQVQAGSSGLPCHYAYDGMQQTVSYGQGGYPPSSGVDLPRIEIASYDGSPLKYWSFKRAFEVNIANRVRDPGMRFSYLQHYCKGKAQVAINDCAIMDPCEAYSEAWKLLEKQFGKPHKIVNCMLQDLLGGGPISDDLESMESLARSMRGCLITMTQMGKVSDLDYTPRLLELTSRLPVHLQVKWSERAGLIIDRGSEPLFIDVLQFIEHRISAMDNVYGMAASEANRVHQPKPIGNRYQHSRLSNIVASALPACGWCSRTGHGLGGCRAFAEAPLYERRDFIRKNKRCFVCLNNKHFAIDCKSNVRCTVNLCNGRHHTLLHASPPQEAMTKTNANVSTGRVRLGFIPVVLKGTNREIVTNALVDNGSDVTLISAKLSKLLQLEGESKVLNIRTLHGSQSTSSRCVTLQLGSTDGEFLVTASNVFTIDSLPCSRVDRPIDLARWSHLKDVKVEVAPHDEVGLLIGCDIPEAHWVLDQRVGKSDEPHAVQTPFGWTVRGNVGTPQGQVGRVNCMRLEESSIEKSMERMYEREFKWSEEGDTEALSKDDARALAVVERNTRLVNDRYEVGVPWKHDPPCLADNKCLAVSRVGLLKKRLLKDESLLLSYHATISSHLEKGYVSIIDSESARKRWYLPHHPVVNPKKPGKVRIVFDCAAKYHGQSLNDELLSGPNLNNDLAGVLLRFREGPVAAAADIEEMFLRVLLPERDRWAFSFLWWTNDNLLGDPVVFQWNVHPFGATSSPFCAAYALRKVSSTCSPEIFGPCIKAIKDNFYVDDCLLASVSKDAAATVAFQLTQLLSRGGFRLTKWVSNLPETLNLLSKKDHLPVAECRDLIDKTSHSTLGLLWDTQQDTIKVDLRLALRPTTKRGVLSCIASFFDPLGVIGPLLLPARKFLQRLCNQGLGWDSQLSASDIKWWMAWKERMADTASLEIPRYHLGPAASHTSHQLHLFSDASETGYGAVAYLRSEASSGTVHCCFLMGKSRVVPSKPITVPRLELTAAVLAIKMMRFLTQESRLVFSTTYLWTDSTIVLHYLRNTTCRFKTFVANRVGYILEQSTEAQWRHVPTSCNPADLASRGTSRMTPAEIDLWLNGPIFLKLGIEAWPQTKLEGRDLSADEETKRVTVIMRKPEPNPILSKLILRYSTWEGMIKGVAWLRRFVRYVVIMGEGNRDYGLRVGPLSVNELESAENRLVSLIQEECFSTELSDLKLGTKGKLNSSLARLKPVLHDGIMCLGGRLPKSLVILPQRHPAVDRLISYHHEVCGHMGASHVLANLRRKYWLVKGMSTVRRIIGKCIRCKIASAKPIEQVMASLPDFRINEGGSPFLETGVDYFGPFEIKKGRIAYKRYGCLFTCMKTRAVHIEIAHAMTTDSFLMALIRFVGRRGVPVNIYSDNGSNFVGAEAELQRQVTQLNQRQISAALTTKGITWHFNPPHASHRGGVWERMIRTTRRVLSAVVKHQALTDESLATFMVEAERLINDRPIAPVYDDPTEPKALRPSDLLLLRCNAGIPTTEVSLLERYTKAWRQAQHLAAVFWKRWIRQYIPTLQLSSRWNVARREVRVGDLVLLIGGTSAYGRWPKGVIQGVKESHDGHVRDVTVRTSTGTVDRDIRSVTLLEADFEVESHLSDT